MLGTALMRMEGEVALVTGSTAGLGREIAGLFAREGAHVVVTGRDHDRGAAVVSEIESDGGTAWFVAGDLAEEDVCAHLVASSVDRFGALTVLVNNAVSVNVDRTDGPVTTVDTATWESTLRVNLLAVAWLCRAAIPEMRRAGHGAIVNVSSKAAVRGTPGLAAYSASKGALEALTRSIAMDHAADNVRCNAIGLGYVLNERRDANLDDERRTRLADMHLTRVGTASDGAFAALYLASRESEFVTGITLPVDGGSTTARARRLG
jgi:meso-butanediol dehydrogenase/(S,S)-butanediol dehydrogenase/diacetyl reductase